MERPDVFERIEHKTNKYMSYQNNQTLEHLKQIDCVIKAINKSLFSALLLVILQKDVVQTKRVFNLIQVDVEQVNVISMR